MYLDVTSRFPHLINSGDELVLDDYVEKRSAAFRGSSTSTNLDSIVSNYDTKRHQHSIDCAKAVSKTYSSPYFIAQRSKSRLHR